MRKLLILLAILSTSIIACAATYTVTSLEDTEAEGTLRWALKQESPKTVLFGASGVIEPAARLMIPNGTTLDGSTAPAPGVCIKGSVDVGSDCVVRYIRVRPGGVSSGDALQIIGSNVLIEHCSLSWGNDENIGVKRVEGIVNRNVEIAWCILAEAGKGMLAWYCDGLKFHHNVLAHQYIRNPVFTGYRTDIFNNVIYDIGDTCVALKGDVSANIVGNYFKVGNWSRLHRYCVNIENLDTGVPSPTTQIYISGNSGPRTREGQPEWTEVRYDNGGEAAEAIHRAYKPFDGFIGATDADTAYIEALASAGASLPARDSVDERVVQEVREGLRPGSYPRGPAARWLRTSQLRSGGRQLARSRPSASLPRPMSLRWPGRQWRGSTTSRRMSQHLHLRQQWVHSTTSAAQMHRPPLLRH